MRVHERIVQPGGGGGCAASEIFRIRARSTRSALPQLYSKVAAQIRLLLRDKKDTCRGDSIVQFSWRYSANHQRWSAELRTRIF